MSKDDEFSKHISNVNPLKDDGRIEIKKKFNKSKQAPKIFIDHAPDEFYEATDQLLFERSPLSKATLRRLKRGEYRIEDEIDLHGLRSDQAETYLHEFLLECEKNRHRCIRIVHGKGRTNPDGPVLKNKLNKWLKHHHHVQAFCSAVDRDGGTGALYVLLDF